ncbi:MAG: DUF5320 domain-containing protein [Patescibacteria group bacterium]
MPGQDGTGPMGQGPLSGRGMGQCQDQAVRGFGRGMRRGSCRFQGRGGMQVDLESEKKMLQDELKAVEEEIKTSKKS